MQITKDFILSIDNCPAELRRTHLMKWHHVAPHDLPPGGPPEIVTLCRAGCNNAFHASMYQPAKKRIRPHYTPVGSCAQVINTTQEIETVYDEVEADTMVIVKMRRYDFRIPRYEPNVRQQPGGFHDVCVWWGRCPECGGVHWTYRILN